MSVYSAKALFVLQVSSYIFFNVCLFVCLDKEREREHVQLGRQRERERERERERILSAELKARLHVGLDLMVHEIMT